MTDRTLVELRCSAIVFREERLLLLRRCRDGAEDWVLPGGHPRPREGVAACVEREVLEETGIRIQAPRVAFVLETTDPAGDRRLIELVFLAGYLRGLHRTQLRTTAPYLGATCGAMSAGTRSRSRRLRHGEPSVPSTRSARLRAAVTTCGAPP